MEPDPMPPRSERDGGTFPRNYRELIMDKDRIAGAAKEAKGAVKDAAGKAVASK